MRMDTDVDAPTGCTAPRMEETNALGAPPSRTLSNAEGRRLGGTPAPPPVRSAPFLFNVSRLAHLRGHDAGCALYGFIPIAEW
jgi:hypothetical protein